MLGLSEIHCHFRYCSFCQHFKHIKTLYPRKTTNLTSFMHEEMVTTVHPSWSNLPQHLNVILLITIMMQQTN